MSTSIEIFSKVNDYIERQITLAELESWLVPMLPTFLLNPDSSAAEFASMIELGLAEIRIGLRNERSFKRLLSQHATGTTIKSESYPYQTTTNETGTSVSVTDATPLKWLDPSPSWSTAPQVEDV